MANNVAETRVLQEYSSRGDKVWTDDLCVPKMARRIRRFSQARKREQPCASILIWDTHQSRSLADWMLAFPFWEVFGIETLTCLSGPALWPLRLVCPRRCRVLRRVGGLRQSLFADGARNAVGMLLHPLEAILFAARLSWLTNVLGWSSTSTRRWCHTEDDDPPEAGGQTYLVSLKSKSICAGWSMQRFLV